MKQPTLYEQLATLIAAVLVTTALGAATLAVSYWCGAMAGATLSPELVENHDRTAD